MSEIVIQHALTFYDLLKKGADKEGIYTGSIVRAFDELQISRQHYSRVVKSLQEAGAIEILVMGRGTSQTQIKLGKKPKPEELVELMTLLKGEQETTTITLERRVAAIERRLGGIDITKAFVDLDSRVKSLENPQTGG